MRALASFSDDDGGNCFPSLAKLATRSQCSQPTAKRVLKRLRQNNWIAVKRTGRSNQYQILKHGCVMPQGKEAIVTLQRDHGDQRLLSGTLLRDYLSRNHPQSPRRGGGGF